MIAVIIDDNPINVDVLEKFLKKTSDFEIAKCYSAKECLNYLEKNYQKVSLIISDLTMPEISGEALCKILMENQKYKHIPVVACSSCLPEQPGKLSEFGFVDWIGKPISKKTLIDVIAKIGFPKPDVSIKNILDLEGMTKEELIAQILAEREEKQLFIESSYDGYWDWMVQEDYEYMSPRFWEIFGVDYKTTAIQGEQKTLVIIEI